MSAARELAFVRALQRQGRAVLGEEHQYVITTPQREFTLPVKTCAKLVSAGVLQTEGERLLPTGETIAWVRRQLATKGEQFAAQHRAHRPGHGDTIRNALESPLARLAARGTDKHSLADHQLEAGLRFTRLFERAALRQRVTMSYDPQRVAETGKSAPLDKTLNGMNIDARRDIERIYAALPSDCVSVIVDVCGFEKGLQQIEQERGWPRRSARLVLKIALDQLAMHFGLMPIANGPDAGHVGGWRDAGARPMSLG